MQASIVAFMHQLPQEIWTFLETEQRVTDLKITEKETANTKVTAPMNMEKMYNYIPIKYEFVF